MARSRSRISTAVPLSVIHIDSETHITRFAGHIVMTKGNDQLVVNVSARSRMTPPHLQTPTLRAHAASRHRPQHRRGPHHLQVIRGEFANETDTHTVASKDRRQRHLASAPSLEPELDEDPLETVTDEIMYCYMNEERPHIGASA